MAMLLSHQGMGQWRGVVSVQRHTYAGRYTVMLVHALRGHVGSSH